MKSPIVIYLGPSMLGRPAGARVRVGVDPLAELAKYDKRAQRARFKRHQDQILRWERSIVRARGRRREHDADLWTYRARRAFKVITAAMIIVLILTIEILASRLR